MKSRKVGDVAISTDANGNLFMRGKATIPITKENAVRIFGKGVSIDPNNGLFPMIAGKEMLCLSIMPDDVIKVALTKKQVNVIMRMIGIK